MMRMRLRLLLASLGLLCAARHAAAQGGDGLYHRFDGDLTLAAVVSGGVHWEETQSKAAALTTGELHARYLDSAGALLAVEHVDGRRVGVLTGVDVRPVFLARFFTNAFTGHRWLDLAVDSFTLEMGTWLGPLDGGKAGAALLLGVSVELPVWVEDAHRVGVALGWRYVHANPDEQLGAPPGVGGTRLFAALVFTTSASTGLSGWEPPRYRP